MRYGVDPDKKALRTMIATWEKRRRQADKMVVRLRSALDLLDKTAAASEMPRPHQSKKRAEPLPAPVPFARKYEKTAKGYILELLSENRDMTMREVRDTLAKRRLTYSGQALALSMKSLENAGKVKKRAAPKGRGASYVYSVMKNQEELSL